MQGTQPGACSRPSEGKAVQLIRVSETLERHPKTSSLVQLERWKEPENKELKKLPRACTTHVTSSFTQPGSEGHRRPRPHSLGSSGQRWDHRCPSPRGSGWSSLGCTPAAAHRRSRQLRMGSRERTCPMNTTMRPAPPEDAA